jgi:hypothetical protein
MWHQTERTAQASWIQDTLSRRQHIRIGSTRASAAQILEQKPNTSIVLMRIGSNSQKNSATFCTRRASQPGESTSSTNYRHSLSPKRKTYYHAKADQLLPQFLTKPVPPQTAKTAWTEIATNSRGMGARDEIEPVPAAAAAGGVPVSIAAAMVRGPKRGGEGGSVPVRTREAGGRGDVLVLTPRPGQLLHGSASDGQRPYGGAATEFAWNSGARGREPRLGRRGLRGRVGGRREAAPVEGERGGAGEPARRWRVACVVRGRRRRL